MRFEVEVEDEAWKALLESMRDEGLPVGDTDESAMSSMLEYHGSIVSVVRRVKGEVLIKDLRVTTAEEFPGEAHEPTEEQVDGLTKAVSEVLASDDFVDRDRKSVV